jgi:hypothetical protein
VTLDPAVETATVSDIYCKRSDTNGFSGTPQNIADYLKNIKFLMLLGNSTIFWDNIKYTRVWEPLAESILACNSQRVEQTKPNFEINMSVGSGVPWCEVQLILRQCIPLRCWSYCCRL